MSENLWKIPPSWSWAKIEDVGRVVSGGTPSTKEPSFWGEEVVWFSPADLTGYTAKYIARGAKSLSNRGLANSSAQLMPQGAVMFSSRAPIGYVAIASVAAATNQGFKSVIPGGGIFNEYLYYYLKAAKHLADERATGTTFKEISGSAFAKLPVPVAPSAEQRRIVAKIDELFSELDKGVESLATARKQLAAYRQAVLKHAFEGKLMGNGMAGWRVFPVSELLSAPLCNGRSVKDRAGGFPVLRLTALKHGRIDLSESKEGAWDHSTALPFLVVPGDFFVARGNGSKQLVGIGGLVGDVPKDVAFPDTMIRLRLDAAKVDSRYFALCWNSRLLRQQIERDARTTAGIYKINQDHISAFRMPVPSLDEQRLIVSQLARNLSDTDFALQQVDVELGRAAALRQSILRRAFSGQLIAQDSTDEPASVLLERIRAEREDEAPKRGRKAKNGKKEAA